MFKNIFDLNAFWEENKMKNLKGSSRFALIHQSIYHEPEITVISQNIDL